MSSKCMGLPALRCEVWVLECADGLPVKLCVKMDDRQVARRSQEYGLIHRLQVMWQPCVSKSHAIRNLGDTDVRAPAQVLHAEEH